jgi:hypothetical protein
MSCGAKTSLFGNPTVFLLLFMLIFRRLLFLRRLTLIRSSVLSSNARDERARSCASSRLRQSVSSEVLVKLLSYVIASRWAMVLRSGL